MTLTDILNVYVIAVYGTLLTAILFVLISSPTVEYYLIDAQEDSEEERDIPDVNIDMRSETATVTDSKSDIEQVAEGLEFPTTMAFLGRDDFLVLEKEKGTVQRIIDGEMLSEPLLDVNVAISQERCMFGIVVSTDHIP